MKKKMRLISSVLILAMLAGAASSCSSDSSNSSNSTASGETQAEDSESNVLNLTIYEWGWEGPEEGKDEVAPLIEEATGMKINLSRWIINSQEDYRRQMSLWTSANTLPEMLAVPADYYTTELINELGDAGRLWEVDGMLDKVYEEAKEGLTNAMTLYRSQETGKIYFYPTQNSDYEAQIEQDNIAQTGIMIRKDWLDELGLGYPQTPDELYNVLKRFKEEIKLENGQSVIPVSFNEGQSGLNNWQAMFFDREEDRPGLWKQNEDGTYTNQYDQEKLTEYAVFMNKLFREELLDPEFATIKSSQYQEKIGAGRVGASGESYWNMNTYNDNLQTTDPDALYVFAPIPKAEGVNEPVQQWVTTGAPCGVILNKEVMSEEKFNKVTDMLAYLSTPEGVITVWYGEEGKHWEKNENGKIQFTQAFMEETNGDYNKQYHVGVGYYVGLCANLNVINPYVEAPEVLSRPDMVESRKNLQNTIFYADEPQDMVQAGPVESEKTTAISTGFNEMIVQAIIAPTEEKCRQIVSEWPATWESLGGLEMTEERNQRMQESQQQ